MNMLNIIEYKRLDVILLWNCLIITILILHDELNVRIH